MPLDLATLHSGVGDRLLEGLEHQIFSAFGPTFPEAGAAHADDRYTVADSVGHVIPPSGHAARLPSRSSVGSRARDRVLDPEQHA